MAHRTIFVLVSIVYMLALAGCGVPKQKIPVSTNPDRKSVV